MTGLGSVLALTAYAGLLWATALALDAIGRRSCRGRSPREHEELALGSDVARFHRVIGGAVLGAGAFLLSAHVVARRDAAAFLLVPVAAACLAGAVRRVVPLWREP